MAELVGLREYLNGPYNKTIFDDIYNSGNSWFFHMHDRKVVKSKILENLKYDVRIKTGDSEELIQKTEIKLLYPEENSEKIRKIVSKMNKKVEKLNFKAIVDRRNRFFIKNKTLFPMMVEKEVVFITLLEGEIIKGIISDFTRFEITLNLKGGIPVTLLRHSIYDARNKKGRCLLKSTQQKSRDWKKSPVFVE